MKTAKEALANHLGYDMSELSEYNYQPGRFTKAVYAIGERYYCACKDTNVKLPKPTRKDSETLQWMEVSDRFVNQYGWLIFKA